MSALSKILRKTETGLAFWCPACQDTHHVNVNPGWVWNGDSEKPTFTPSVLVTGHKLSKNAAGRWTGSWERNAAGDFIAERCHSFVTDGRIQFLADCTHALAGQTVDLPPWPDEFPS